MPGQPLAQAEALTRFAALLDSVGEERPGGDGVMVVVAHPDDETIGIGGQLRRLRQATIVHVTGGAPRNMDDARAHGFTTWQAYAAARRRELEAAMAEAGIPASALIALNVPDQEAARRMPELARKVADLFQRHQTRFVCTHPYEGGHPDHDATAFAVEAACRAMRRDGLEPPAVIEMPFYHAGPDGPVFQDFPAEPDLPRHEVELNEHDLAMKRRMAAHHVTQQAILAPFTARVERFRAAPHYAFGSLPNGGRLYYESLPFGFHGEDWLALAGRAMEELGWEDRQC